eukprot:5885231-Prymnesium_polylepis.1
MEDGRRNKALWKTEGGIWKTEGGIWKTEDGIWKTEDGIYMEDGRRTGLGSGRERTRDGRSQKTEAEDGTKDGRWKRRNTQISSTITLLFTNPTPPRLR